MPPHTRPVDQVGEAIMVLQSQYGLSRDAFVHLHLSARFCCANMQYIGSNYDFKRGPVHQNMSDDDWERRRGELIAGIRKHVPMGLWVRCAPGIGLCLLPLSILLCPDNPDAVEEFTDKTLEDWNAKDEGKIEWSRMHSLSGVCGRVWVSTDVVGRSLKPPPAKNLPNASAKDPAAIELTQPIAVADQRPPAYADATLSDSTNPEVNKAEPAVPVKVDRQESAPPL